MNIIGFSGLHGSVAFKRRELPGLDERKYRIAQGFDSAAALVDESGVVAAVAEERHTGEKATGAFPVNAVLDCLRQGGIGFDDIDFIAHGFAYPAVADPGWNELDRRRHEEVHSRRAQLAVLEEFLPGGGWDERFVAVPHHLAHAASAYHLSGHDESLVLVADGMGESDSLTVAVGSGGKLDVLATAPAMASLGILYSVFTLYLGFEMAMDEYKVMGLAPFGDPSVHRADLQQIVRLRSDGRHQIPLLLADDSALLNETHDGVLAELESRFGPARGPGDPLLQRHRDLAAALQERLVECVLHILGHFREVTGLRRLVMAGGTALNCAMNGQILRSGLFDEVFVQPAAGDDGTSLGAALYLRAQELPQRPLPTLGMPYHGPSFDDEEIVPVLRAHPECSSERFDDPDVLAARVAELLAAGRIVAWFQGRMEFGPRALGNRSILADPRQEAMRDRINLLVKRREDFRPFAPVVVAEEAETYFEIPGGRPEVFRHMLFVTRTRPEWRTGLGAVTHVDGTARVQTIRNEDNARLHGLLRAFERHAGVPVLLNTSFNLRGQPIVRDPETAVSTYARSDLDHLVIGDHLVTRVR